MSILNNIFYKYVFVCKEFFNSEVVLTEPDRALDNIIGWKKQMNANLCELQHYLDASIGFNEMNDISQQARDDMYSMTNNKDNNINGSIDNSKNEQIQNLIISETNQFCEINHWNPEIIEDKDSIVVYITILINEYNKQIQLLEKDKVTLSSYITEFNRFLTQYLDNKLLPKCNMLNTVDHEVLCASKDLTESTNETASQKVDLKVKHEIEMKKAILSVSTIDSKKKILDKDLCKYIQKYKQIEQIRSAIVMYVNKLNTIWSSNDINKTKIRLNYAKRFHTDDTNNVEDTDITTNASLVQEATIVV
jgi:hypothetical protein